MTIRRKFFPTRPVQIEPGHSVDVTVQLHRGGGVKPDCPCVIHGAHWSVNLLGKGIVLAPPGGGDFRYWRVWQEQSGAPMRIIHATYSGEPHIHTYTDGHLERQQQLDGPSFFCDNLAIDRPIWSSCLNNDGQNGILPPVLLGTLIGTNMTDVHWQTQWEPVHPDNAEKSFMGDYCLTAGNVLCVYRAYGRNRSDFDGPSFAELNPVVHLQATAWCGGAEVAELALAIYTVNSSY